jgi:beta-glucosidase
MDLHELVSPLAGIDWWNTPAAAGVPAMKVTDGPSGARGELFVGGPPSVWFPCGAALGATWDVELLERVGAALADETRAKGAHVLLGPTVNLQRDPLGGRHFECMSEDPVLTAALCAAYIRGLQSRGVGACVKHLVANDAEDDRFEVSSDVDERTLREVSLVPFEHALRSAGSWAVMAAYNRLNGTHCSEHPWLLTTVLRDEWGWDGAVISDWFGTRSTVAAALAGLDLEMPGPPNHFGARLAAAVAADEVPRDTIEAKVDHLRRLAARAGADAAPPAPDGPGGRGRAIAVAYEAAASAAVLLRNEVVADRPCLPLDRASIGSVAVIGPNAHREIAGGGGSARLTPMGVTTLLTALRRRLGDERVLYEPGCRNDRGTPSIDGSHARRSDGTRGVDVELLDRGGEVRVALRPSGFQVLLAAEPWPGAPARGWTLRASCTYGPSATGEHRFKLKTNFAAQLTVDGRVVLDTRTGDAGGSVELIAGEDAAIEVTASPPDDGGGVFRYSLELRCAPPFPDDAIDRAVEAARGADAAVVVLGLDGEWETEGRDRDDLSLPGQQAELVRAVAAAQPRAVAVVLAGSPVDLSWAGEVPALLWAWYPGQEGGDALADVLLGEVDPGGRLPCTFPGALEDTLADPPSRGSGHVPYREGVFAGHRRYDHEWIEPIFPFGHGLSYSTFTLGPPRLSRSTIDPGESVAVSVEVANVGDRGGCEVVQLYVRDVESSVPRADRELRAFAKVRLAPGETRTLELVLGPRDLAFWDVDASCWRAEAGSFELTVGRTSRDLRGTTTLELTRDWTAPASWWPAAP